MRKHSLAKGCVVAALVLGQTAPAMADADGLVGGVVGGIIGGIIVNEANKNKRTTTVRRTTTRTGLTSAQREANREVQVALNYFGYPVGTPDGVLGRQSRAGISDYQLTLGYTPTGQLTEFERSHLIGSYHRAIAGGAMTMQQAAANPMGLRGLLVTWRDEAAGITVPAVPQQGQMALVAEPPAALAPEAAPVIAATAPAAEPANGGLPTFLGNAGTGQASLASTCNKVAMMTTTNGGYTTVANMTDPSAALGEQFCLARSYAIATGEEMAAQVPGTTPAQIAEQCAGFAPAMKAEVAALSLQPATDVLAETRSFALSTGMSPAQLAATAKICLSVGYAQDNMDVAVGSALILTALGEAGYGELLGHHLSQGFGATQRADLAFDWYGMAIGAAEKGATPVFAPGQPERMALVRKAAYAITGRDDEAAAPPVKAALPTFQVPAPAGDAATGTAE